MSNTKLIAVVGATGKQGSSVIKSLLHEPGYKLRGLTRDPSRANAQALAKQGVEMVKADMSSLADLTRAFAGAHAVFAVTDFWSSLDKAKEIEDGKRQAQAAREAGVEHFIWSSIDSVSELSKGKLVHVEHFDAKWEVEKALPELLGSKTHFTVFMPAAYWENFGSNFLPRKGADGVFTLSMPIPPDTVYSGYQAGEDTGSFVKAILKAGPTVYGQRVYACSEELRLGDMLAQWGELNCVKTQYKQIPADVYKSFLPPAVAEDLYEMLAWFHEFGYYNRADVQPSQRLVTEDKLVTWRDYVKKTQWEL